MSKIYKALQGLKWDAIEWLSKRVAKPDGTKYTLKDIDSFNSHIPEYQQIEKEAKANGSWLKMDDGSTWEGDPRVWVMMQSKSFKKNYSSKPWWTGQAQWKTRFNYGNGDGEVDTDKMTRAPYYNGLMWFSNSKSYGDVFAHAIDSKGRGERRLSDSEKNIKGTNFLAAIPKQGNFRFLEAPPQGTYDHWFGLPYRRTATGIERVKKNPEEFLDRGDQNVYIPNAKQGDWETTYKTDDVVDWSKDLGDLGIFMNKIYDGPNKIEKDSKGEYRMKGDPLIENSIDEFISQPGFTNKIKFIEGNNGDFDINNPYKYAYINMKKEDYNLYAKNGGSIKADNARKWKHKLGGNIIKALEGSKLTKALNSDLGKGLTSLAVLGEAELWKSSLANSFSKNFDKATDSLTKLMKKKSWGEKYNEALKFAPLYFQLNALDGVHYGVIDYQEFAKAYADSNIDLDSIEQFKYERELLKQNLLNAILGNSSVSDILLQGLGLVGNYLSNKPVKEPTSVGTTNVKTNSLGNDFSSGYITKNSVLYNPDKFWNLK